jgi:hypothetical protein
MISQSTEHCIESLRISLTCQPDMTAITYNWKDGNGIPEANFNAPRTCIDWERLHCWALEKSFSVKDKLIPDRNGKSNCNLFGDLTFTILR